MQRVRSPALTESRTTAGSTCVTTTPWGRACSTPTGCCATTTRGSRRTGCCGRSSGGSVAEGICTGGFLQMGAGRAENSGVTTPTKPARKIAKKSVTKTVAKRTLTTKPAVKKTATKKTVAKKTVAKKTVAKKTVAKK